MSLLSNIVDCSENIIELSKSNISPGAYFLLDSVDSVLHS